MGEMSQYMSTLWIWDHHPLSTSLQKLQEQTTLILFWFPTKRPFQEMRTSPAGWYKNKGLPGPGRVSHLMKDEVTKWIGSTL
jgi:hypothetical protein